MIARIAGVLFFIVFIQGCSTLSEGRGAPVSSPGMNYERHCSSSVPLEPLDADASQMSSERMASLKGQFTLTSFKTATALGVVPFLDRLLILEAQVGPGGEGPALEYVRERRHITDRITLGILDVSSLAVEADCEEGRASLLAEHLQKSLDKRQNVYTVLGLVGSGVLTIISGAIGVGASSIGVLNTANVATVIGGASELIFGSAALMDTTGTEELHHERNLLRDIWTGENSAFVPTVWSFLNTRSTEEPTEPTLRESLIVRWREEGRLGPPGSDTERHRIDLFFGNGGRYTIDELRARAAMLDLLETEISLMHQGMNRLIRELLKRDKV
ncbi:MAG TPA: hypothetical protein VL261_04540 [Nitrospira sp.]|nr:hypothetical protein [Nitrospira sp.]